MDNKKIEINQLKHIDNIVNINDKFFCYLCCNTFTQKTNLQRHLREKRCKSEFSYDLIKLNDMIKILSEKATNNTILKRDINIVNNIINNITNNNNIDEYKNKYIMPSGKIITYQGYENYALDELLLIYSEQNIVINDKNRIPTIEITFNGKLGKYYPDIYIISENKIIEVKSDWTYKADLEKNEIKAEACKKAGYIFEFWIYTIKSSKIEKIIKK